MNLAAYRQRLAKLGRPMLNHTLQHIDVALGADAAVDTRMNGQTNKKSRIHVITENLRIDTAGGQSFDLGFRRQRQHMSSILKPCDGFMPLLHVLLLPTGARESAGNLLSEHMGTATYRQGLACHIGTGI